MRAHIVVESFFGNTEQIARAVAEGLESGGAGVSVARTDAPVPDGADLLVIGSPTHNMGLPSPGTRRMAIADGGHDAGDGLAGWLGRLDGPPARIAVFSTVVDSRLHGSATKPIVKRLRRTGSQVVATEDFRVVGTKGPLVDGELSRARQWGRSLV